VKRFFGTWNVVNVDNFFTSATLPEETFKDRQCTYKLTEGHIPAKLLWWKSNECYTTWACVFVVLHIQHAMRMRQISNDKFHDIPSSRSKGVLCRLTDGQTWRS